MDLWNRKEHLVAVPRIRNATSSAAVGAVVQLRAVTVMSEASDSLWCCLHVTHLHHNPVANSLYMLFDLAAHGSVSIGTSIPTAFHQPGTTQPMHGVSNNTAGPTTNCYTQGLHRPPRRQRRATNKYACVLPVLHQWVVARQRPCKLGLSECSHEVPCGVVTASAPTPLWLLHCCRCIQLAQIVKICGKEDICCSPRNKHCVVVPHYSWR